MTLRILFGSISSGDKCPRGAFNYKLNEVKKRCCAKGNCAGGRLGHAHAGLDSCPLLNYTHQIPPQEPQRCLQRLGDPQRRHQRITGIPV